MCAVFCSGASCKYCDFASVQRRWPLSALKGSYASWVCHNILAMSRPTEGAVREMDLVGQLKRAGVVAIFNLQEPGEHDRCGQGLADVTGFAYRPESFVEKGISVHNFGWPDFGVPTASTMLTMVKQMAAELLPERSAGAASLRSVGSGPSGGQDALEAAVAAAAAAVTSTVNQPTAEPAGAGPAASSTIDASVPKVAVHCHAGLGRTGVLIASYLVYALGFDADHAIHLVRLRRPRSIQTRRQVQSVRDLSAYLLHAAEIFPPKQEPAASAQAASSGRRPTAAPRDMSLAGVLQMQRALLVGQAAELLYHIPRLVYVCCARIPAALRSTLAAAGSLSPGQPPHALTELSTAIQPSVDDGVILAEDDQATVGGG